MKIKDDDRELVNQNKFEFMKTLNLTLKKKWFDMIASGEKKEEYRCTKPYWWTRLVQCGEIYGPDPLDENGLQILPVEQWTMILSKNFDVVAFRNGYGKNAPVITLQFKGIEIGKAKPEWSDNWQGDVFIIKLGEIIK